MNLIETERIRRALTHADEFARECYPDDPRSVHADACRWNYLLGYLAEPLDMSNADLDALQGRDRVAS